MLFYYFVDGIKYNIITYVKYLIEMFFTEFIRGPNKGIPDILIEEHIDLSKKGY